MSLDRSLPHQPRWRRPGVAWEARRMARYEVEMSRRFDETWVVSPVDREVLNGRGSANVVEVALGVDDSLFEIPRATTEPPSVVFVGNLGVPHNVDAAGFAARVVWPLVRAKVPRARLRLVGADPAASVRALGGLDGVEVTGALHDLATVWSGASALLAPLRFSSGAQTKIVEAMAAGVPVVTTPAAAAALHLGDGECLRIGETPADLAAAVVWALTNPSAADMAARGRDVARTRHRWAHAVDRLEVLVGRASHRSRTP
jgi:glycosyltransferase involved in cell wall biosynthesis